MTTEQPSVLPVLQTGTTLDEQGTRWPTAVIDPTDFPEVADLARVHASEGIGDISTEALLIPVEDEHVLLLGIRVTSPVVCAFALAFSLPNHRQVLDEATEAGHLLLATTPPESAVDEHPLWLAIDLDTDTMTNLLP